MWGTLGSVHVVEKKQQVPPLRCAPVGMTILLEKPLLVSPNTLF